MFLLLENKYHTAKNNPSLPLYPCAFQFFFKKARNVRTGQEVVVGFLGWKKSVKILA